jgi:ethanolamine utilization protein EutN
MELARVIGVIVCERKYEGLTGVKLLLVQPVEPTLLPKGEPLVVADRFSAGIGQIVWWVGGREAALTLKETFVPIDAGVVAIADDVYAEGILARGSGSK